MLEFIQEIGLDIIYYVREFGYIGIILLMALESSFVPFPSEVVIIPAGWIASQTYVGQIPEGDGMNIILVIICGILGSIIGALFNYYLAIYLGRPFILKWGKYFLLNEKRFSKVEEFFINHGSISTFVGRLIIGVRQYISFPAGLARMRISLFTLYTALGAGIWVTILALIGWSLHISTAELTEEAWKDQLSVVTPILGGFCLILVVVYIIWYRWKKNKKDDNQSNAI